MSAPRTSATRITVLGSINTDLVATTPRLPAPGETILGHTFSTGSGGKGANQAIAAARAGAEVRFLGAVGDDAFALDLREALVEAEVDATLLREVAGPSGVAIITVDDAGENSIIVVAGANATVVELTDPERDAIAGAAVLLCQLELPLTAITAAARHARAHGTTVVLNPSPAVPLPDELLDCVDVLVVNETESAQLGATTLDRMPHVVTTLGARGARWRGPDGATHHCGAPTVDVVDTTGAGDAFAGALVACWDLGPHEALRHACAAGALTAARPGAGSSPTREEIDAMLGSAR
ncbi:ribokinase [Rhodococcus daqingensis]|uniref:Ribokinase n=1 Tax=Rhodococcus daqingensis TaxID=2479363 RepID=A0ABW2S3X2_9NOCA